MITEQEVMKHINDKISKKETFSQNSQNFIGKLKTLDEILKKQVASLDETKAKIADMESDIMRTKGAVSILLELVAEEEGLLASTENPNDSNTTAE